MNASVAMVAVVALLSATSGVFAATQSLAPSDDTFINSASADNNNGASASIFTGRDGRGGFTRGLIRFSMPPDLAGRATVTASKLTLTTRALGNGGPVTAATMSLHPLAVAWVQGVGAGNNPTLFVVGQPCTGSDPSWNHPQCTTGAWPAIGTVSATASVAVTVTAAVSWSSAAMNADIQGWIDTPSTNNGWLITSSSEADGAASTQRFFASESGTSLPSLSITYSCKPGFVGMGTQCIADSPPPPSLDIDGNGSYDALTDGLLIIRYMFGLRGTALIANAIGPMATRATSEAIEARIAAIGTAFDIDANAEVDALTDGLIALRYLFGLRGDAATANAIGPNAQRSSSAISAYLQTLTP